MQLKEIFRLRMYPGYKKFNCLQKDLSQAEFHPIEIETDLLVHIEKVDNSI